MFSDHKRNLVLTAIALSPCLAHAAEAAPKHSELIGGLSVLYYTLMGLAIVLLYFIATLANTLRVLSEVAKGKFRDDRKKDSTIAKALLLLVTFSGMAMSVFAAEPDAVSKVKYIGGIPSGDYYLLIGFIMFELVIIFALSMLIRIVSKTIRGQYDTVNKKVEQTAGAFWDEFHAATPIEKEKDILLDHNYDGIQELDNSLPPWWKYGFYLTIVVAFIYIYRYHFSGDGLSQQEEYVAEMQQGEADKAAYLAVAGNKVDENSVTLLTDAAELAAGKELFAKNCVACHLADGGGSVGPNLTDEYWLHGGSVKDIFKTIKYGWQDKGMKSWKDDFSPKQIQQLTSYVRTLKGTKPAVPKAQQGELYIEAGAPVTSDSVNKPVDSSTAGKK